jgi:hypothetical protein
MGTNLNPFQTVRKPWGLLPPAAAQPHKKQPRPLAGRGLSSDREDYFAGAFEVSVEGVVLVDVAFLCFL